MVSKTRATIRCKTETGPVQYDSALQTQILNGFFARLGRGSVRVLMLDYDGTLAPFRVERGGATPYPGIIDAIERLMRDRHNRIVIVTGRKISDFQAVSGFPPGLEIWGSHGWEHQRSDGTYEVAAGDERSLAGLARVKTWLSESDLSDRTELKPGCIEFHWRGLPEPETDELRRLLLANWPRVVNGSGVTIQEFDGGLSLRMPGRNKGTAVRAVLSRLPEDAVAAYLGDDATDEHAMSALAEPHLGILVRPEYRTTCARAWLRPPVELLEFLDRWIDIGL